MVVVCFEWKHPNGKHVLLAGSFTNWKAYPMIKKDGSWKLQLNLPVGFHHFKFVVDGEWVIDHTQPSVGQTPDLLNIIQIQAQSSQEGKKRDRSGETVHAQTHDQVASAIETGAVLQLGDQLREVHLSAMNLHVPDLAPLFALLKDNKGVHTLNLANNPLGDALVPHISALLSGGGLKVLNLWGTGLSDGGAVALSSAVAKNTSLVSLTLRANVIGAAGSRALAQAVARHPTLEVVDLWWNPFGDEGIRVWADVVEKGRLRELHLGEATLNLEAETKRAWSRAIKSSKTLQYLHLTLNDRRPFSVTLEKLSS